MLRPGVITDLEEDEHDDDDDDDEEEKEEEKEEVRKKMLVTFKKRAERGWHWAVTVGRSSGARLTLERTRVCGGGGGGDGGTQ